jgi:pimeloyl-ACP methyl ester carboxylesterase
MPRIEVNGVALNFQVNGNGEAVLLLHGAPDSAALWRHVAPQLASAGYRTVALDQRGFGESDAPHGVRSYAMNHLVGDALALMDTLGIEKAHLVGHDWGAAVGWVLAGRSPERFHTFTALSLGHSRAFELYGARAADLS